ncbi:MAG: glycosyltransferase family 9 protein [Elusimicrobia bacterium]|nr:glycosyltransferase family 9 protein [Elusimicrobiota bacterium]
MDAQRPEKILVLMLRRIGDVLLTTPAVKALRKAFPEAVIDFLVEPPADQLLRAGPDISSVLRYDPSLAGSLRWILQIRRARYDWVVDFLGTPRTALLSFLSRARVRAGPAQVAHRWAYTHLLRQPPSACYNALEKIRLLGALGLSPDESDCLPELHVPEASQRFARDALAATFGGVERAQPLVGFVPGSRRPTRRWPPGHYAELGRLLRGRQGVKILVFWGPGERERASQVVSGIGAGAALSPPVANLMDLAGLLSACRIVVSNCNGPKHIAAACGVKTLTIHGSSDPACWNPPDPSRHPFIRLEKLQCIGCRLNRCPYGMECMNNLSPQAVSTAAENLLLGAPARCP